MSDNSLATPMTRVYDFSQLTRPLHRCFRVYISATTDGRFRAYMVQSEDMVPVDQAVYVTGDVRDARDAANELNDMIAAARLLVS